MKTIAICRLYYGIDWIEESIRRIAPYVDRVVVFYTGPLAMWGHDYERDPQGVRPLIESLRAEIKNLDTFDVPEKRFVHEGQFSYFINDVVLPVYGPTDTVLIFEYDHLFRDLLGTLSFWETCVWKLRNSCAIVEQIELWRPPQADRWWSIPHRPGRVGPILWDTRFGGVPETIFHGIPREQSRRAARLSFQPAVLNVGYATSEDTMRWKMKCALALGSQDSVPDPRWVDDVYLAWQPGMGNLEISLHHKEAIPFVVPFDEEV